jgi:hypothetical protein
MPANTKRLSIDIPDDVSARLDKCIPWGYRRRIFLTIIDAVCSAVEEHGEFALAAIMMKRVNALELLKGRKDG